MEATSTGEITGLRCYDLEGILTYMATQCQLAITVTVKKYWLSKTVFYQVKGTASNVMIFRKALKRCIEKWNKECNS